MRVKRIRNVLFRLLCITAVTTAVTGCIKEDRDNCGKDCSFTVRAYENDGTELTNGDVGDVVLYVFDDNHFFVECINTRIGENVTVRSAGSDIHVVAWGNLNGNQICNAPADGNTKDDGYVSLLPDNTRSVNYSLSPDELFRGEKTVTSAEQVGEVILPIYRKVGRMTITVRNLKPFAGFDDDDYSIVVSDTYNSIGFDGSFSGDRVAYRPAGSFITNKGKEEFYVPPFNMVPETEGVTVTIYHGTDVVAVVSKSNGGDPITVEKGMLTEVIIDLSRELNVSVSIKGWDDVEVEKEY